MSYNLERSRPYLGQGRIALPTEIPYVWTLSRMHTSWQALSPFLEQRQGIVIARRGVFPLGKRKHNLELNFLRKKWMQRPIGLDHGSILRNMGI